MTLIPVPNCGLPNVRCLSIKPQYADRIKDGTKTIELRSYDPALKPEDWCIVYETHPTGHISFVFQVEYFWCMKPDLAWELFSNQCGNGLGSDLGVEFDDYFGYFHNKPYAYGLKIGQVNSFDPISYQELEETVGFSAPQGSWRWKNYQIDSRILQAMC